MKGLAMAGRLLEKRSATLRESLKVMQTRLSVRGREEMTQEKMAEIFSLDFSRYKRILKNPGIARLEEVWRIIEVAKQYGVEIDVLMEDAK